MADEYVELVESDDDFNEFDDADVSDYVGYGEQEEDLSEDDAIAAQMDASDETSSPFLEPDFPEVTEAEDGETVEIAESDGDDEDEFDVIGDEGVTEFGAMSEDEDLSEDDAIAAQMDTSEEDVIELDYDSPENPDTIECDCICSVKTGDRVMVQLVNGEPTVIGVVGWGDALQSDVDAAKGSAKEAHDAAVAAQEDAAAANASAQSAEASARAASESAGNAIAQAQRAEDAAVAAEGLARTANASAIEAAMRASDAGRSASVAQAALGSMTVDWHDYIAEVIDGEWVVYHKDDASKTNVIGSISMVWQDKGGLHIVGEKGRLDIEQSGITINDSAGAVLASFGSSATIGNDAGGKFVMSDSSLSAYDKGTKYFEVTKDGMKFGLFDVASKGYADTAKSEAISAAAADATSKVNAIQIGGRNLVKNSVWVADGNYSDYKWSKIASRVDTKVGETYTFSLYFNDSLDTTTDHGYGYIHAFDADGNVVVRDYFSTANESQRTKTIGNGIAYLIAYAGVRNCVVGDVYKLKLEAGNKATDWTPAPEDVEADATAKAEAAQNAAIAAAGSEADLKIEAATENMATTDDIPTKVSDLDNDSGFQDASQVQSAANTAKGEAISAAASDATSKADAALAGAKDYVAKSMQFTEDGLEIADMRNGSPVGTRAVLGSDALRFKDADGNDAAMFGSETILGDMESSYTRFSSAGFDVKSVVPSSDWSSDGVFWENPYISYTASAPSIVRFEGTGNNWITGCTVTTPGTSTSSIARIETLPSGPVTGNVSWTYGTLRTGQTIRVLCGGTSFSSATLEHAAIADTSARLEYSDGQIKVSRESNETLQGTGLVASRSGIQDGFTRNISFIVGSGGKNAGVWDGNLNKWQIYTNGSTDRTLLHGNAASVDDSGIYKGLQGSAILVESVSLFSSVSIAAGSYESGTKNLASTHSGYKPIAVVGQYVNNRYTGFGQCYIDDSGVLNYLVHNNTSSARSTTASVRVMYVR